MSPLPVLGGARSGAASLRLSRRARAALWSSLSVLPPLLGLARAKTDDLPPPVANPPPDVARVAAPVAPPAPATLPAATPAAEPANTPANPPKTSAQPVVLFEPVVVTARNREEDAQATPIPVAVLDQRVLERQSLATSGQFVARVPNTTYFDSNPKQTNLSIRGIGKNANNERIETSVGIIVDDVYLVAPGSAASDFVDIDRVEVLRGPQGTLKGKNTTLGVLSIYTKAPSFTPEHWVEVGGGIRDYRSLKLSSTAPLGEKFAYRVSVNYREADGYLENPLQDITLNDTDRVAARVQLLATPTADLSARIILEHSESDEHTVFNPVFIADPATYANGASRGLTYSQRIARPYLQSIYPWTPSQNTFDRFFSNNNTGVETYRDSGTLLVDQQLGEWALASITGLSRFSFDPGNDSDPYDISRAGSTSLSEQWSQELRLTSPLERAVDFQTGVYYLANDYTVTPPTGYGFGRDAALFHATNAQYATLAATPAGVALAQAALDDVRVGTFSHAGSESIAAYLQANWHLSPKATLTVGARHTSEDRYFDTVTRLESALPNVPALGASLGASPAQIAAAQAVQTARTTATVQPFRRVEDSNDSLGWLINPSYRFTDDLLGYAILSYGEKSPVVGFNGATPIVTDPEEVLNAELGVKTTLLDGRLRLNANLYRTLVEGYQTTVRVLDPVFNDGVTYANIEGNVDEIISQGLELEGAYAFSRDVSLSFAGAYTDATFSSFANGPLSSEDQPGSVQFVDYTDEQVPGSSKYSFALGLDASRPIGAGRRVFATLTETYRSGWNNSNNLTSYLEQDAVFLTDATLGISYQDGKYTLSLQGRNLFDEKYFVTGSDGSVGASGGGVYAGSPGPRRFVALVFRATL